LKLETYFKNKDIKIKDDDIDIDSLVADVRKGYVSEAEIEKRVKAVEKEASERLSIEHTKKMAELEQSIATNNKMIDDYVGKNKALSFENKAFERGFKKDDFERLSKLRSTYEGDDDVALDKISTDFRDIFFKESVMTKVPSEAPIGAGGSVKTDIKITKDTPIRDLLKK